MKFNFTGNGVNVFFIVQNSANLSASQRPSLTIPDFRVTVDNLNVTDWQPFDTSGDPQSPFFYNHSIFSKNDLSGNSIHTLHMDIHVKQHSIYFAFDSANYTIEELGGSNTLVPPAPSPSDPASPAGIPSYTLSSPASNSTTISTSPASSGSETSASLTISSSSMSGPSPQADGGGVGAASDSPQSQRLAAIVGGTVGGVVGLALLALLVFFLLRCVRRRRRSRALVIADPLGDITVNVRQEREHLYSPVQISDNGHQALLAALGRQPAELTRSPSRSSIHSTSSTVVVPPLIADAKDRRRHERQLELLEQTRRIEQEIIMLQDELMARSLSRLETDQSTIAGSERGNAADLQAQIRAAKGRLEVLQAAQGSAWAEGLSDYPPSGYHNSSWTQTLQG